MANGLPSKTAVGIPGRSVNIDPATYFLAVRMENAGMLQRGQALALAATLRTKPQKRGAARGRK